MQPECFIIVTVLWVFSVCLHEFGHAFVALKGGDHTVREKGYLSLNPLHYAHPVYSVLMPVVFLLLGGIGLPGGAVYIERQLLRSRAWETWVSLAGPGMNIALLLFFSLLFKTGVIPADPSTLANASMSFLVQLEISSVLLCLLPVPPLDGFQALAPWLPAGVREKMYSFSNVGMFAVFLALWYVAPLRDAFWDAVNWISWMLGVHPAWGWAGYQAFRFWDN